MIINLGQKLSLLGFWPLLRGSEPLCDDRWNAERSCQKEMRIKKEKRLVKIAVH